MSEAMRGDVRGRLIDATMQLAAERPWHEIEIRDIARPAAASLDEFRDHCPSKGAVLGAFAKRIDREVLEAVGEDESDTESPRDRLFDVLMRRVDALAPHKEALRNIFEAVRAEPLTLAALNGVALNSQRFMLQAAGIDVDGPLGAVKLQGTAIAFSRVLRAWMEDDDPDLARTMAVLDRELDRGARTLARFAEARRLAAPFAEFAAGLLGRRRRRRPMRSRDWDRGDRSRRLDDGDPIAV